MIETEGIPKKYRKLMEKAEKMAEQDGLFYETLPFSSLRGWIPEGGIYEDIYRSFNLPRLHRIKALSYAVFNDRDCKYFLYSHHTRLDHSLTTAMVMEGILWHNRFSQAMIDKGITAGLLHDIATPALGDPVTRVDSVHLHEEKYWREFLTTNGASILDKYGIKPEELDEAVSNNGLLGEVLDIADRVTYVCKDFESVASCCGTARDWIDRPDVLELFCLAAGRYLPVGNIYQDVRVKKGEVYFNRPERLARFLWLRILLHQRLYLHPVSQARDLVIANLIRRFYSLNDYNLITPQKLRAMTDDMLLAELARHYPPAAELQGAFMFWIPEFCRIDSSEDEADQIRRLRQNPNLFIIGKRKIREIDSGVHYKVRNASGRIVSFSEFNPEKAKELQDLACSQAGEYLLYMDTREGWQIALLLEEMRRDGILDYPF